jgi:cell division protein FtsL
MVAIGAASLVSITGAPRVAAASESQQHVVSTDEIQTRIDQQTNQADADRQAIKVMLQSEAVRSIAGSAGIDLERASAATGTLSGSALEKMAAQARVVNGEIAGGDEKIVLTTTAVIIILLILILLMN